MTSDLTDKRVLVVGATGGIGSATAEAFAAAGALVVRPDRAALDITDDGSVARFFAAQAPFDHVVVAAARTARGSVETLSLPDAQESMNNKFFGAYRIAKAARIADDGSLTLVSGFLSTRPNGASVLQGAINAAVEALARGLALERAPVRVNTVSPGLVDTPLHAGMAPADREARYERVASRLPARRIGRPTDIASAIVFVATNRFVTGSTLTIDGGGTIAG